MSRPREYLYIGGEKVESRWDLMEQLLSIYEESWQNAEHKSLVEELLQVYRRGVRGCEDMTIDELKHEIEEQQENA